MHHDTPSARANARHRRRAPALATLALLLAGLSGAQAQTWTGLSTTSGSWVLPQNWNPRLTPTSSATTAITFAGTQRLDSIQTLFSPFTLNVLTFATGAGAFSITGNALRFDGSNARLVQNTTSNVALLTEVQVATNLLVDGSGSGTLTLGGNLTRAAGTSRDGLVLTKRGATTVALAGANSFDATVRIEQGQVLLRNALALQSANVALAIDNGLNFGTLAQATLAGLSGSGALALGTTALTLGSADSPGLYGGAITGTTGSVTKVGSGTARWSGISAFDRLQVDAGQLQVEGGTLTLASAAEGLKVGNNTPGGAAGPVLALSGGALVAALGNTAQVDGAAGTALHITGNGTQLRTGFQLLVGNHASGTLQVDGGGSLAADVYLAMGFNSASSGTLSIGADGNVTSFSGLLGVLAGASGSADVAGANARWTTNGLGLGGFDGSLRGGTGTLTVRDGAQVLVQGALTLWTASSSAVVDRGRLQAGGLVSSDGGRVTLVADPADGPALQLGGAFGSFSYNGDLSGDGGLLKTGAATQVLVGRNSFTGPVQVQGGVLEMANSAASDYDVGPLATLRLGERNLGFAVVQAAAGGRVVYTNTSLVGGVLVGPGSHDIDAVRRMAGTRVTGGVALTPASGTSFVGVVNDGRIDNLNGRSLSWTGGSNPSGRVLVAGTTTVSSFSSGGELQVGATGRLVSTGGDLVLGGGSRTAVGAINGPGGTVELQAGGRVQVNGGLLVNNGRILAPVDVNFGSLAKGAGEYGAVVVNDGGRFSPGNSPGTVTTGDADWGAGGTLLVELAAASGTAGVDWDLWTVNGALALQSGSTANSRFTISLQTLDRNDQAAPLAGFDPHRAWQWRIVDTSGGILGFDPARLALDAQGFASPLAGGTLRLAVADGDLYLQFAPVPEPQTWAMLLGGLGLLGWAARRRRVG